MGCRCQNVPFRTLYFCSGYYCAESTLVHLSITLYAEEDTLDWSQRAFGWEYMLKKASCYVIWGNLVGSVDLDNAVADVSRKVELHVNNIKDKRIKITNLLLIFQA